jgi:hypothetical protein
VFGEGNVTLINKTAGNVMGPVVTNVVVSNATSNQTRAW